MPDATLAHTLREGGTFVMYRVGRDCFFLVMEAWFVISFVLNNYYRRVRS